MRRLDPEIPKKDREVVIAPAARGLTELVRANRESMEAFDFTLAGRPAGEFRASAQREIMAAADAYTASLGVRTPEWPGGPVVLTGHQPEFHHPGIWLKNHLAAKLASATGGVGLNLVVDNDVPRKGELALPARTSTGFERREVRFADIDTSRAWEEHTDKRSWRFDRLAAEVKALLPLEGAEPVIIPFMADVAECMTQAIDIVHLMTLLRRRYEETVGLGNLEIPVSVMSETHGFSLFVLALAADAARFARAYNGAVHEFRRVNGIRGRSHPVPDLRILEGRVELPFWVWRPGGKRRRLWITTGCDAELLMDEEVLFTINEGAWQAILADDTDAFDDAAAGMAAEGGGKFRIRPRAISNTMFCRLFASDVFIHGVGGARYDAVTDEVVRRFFGVEPPGFITCSATLFLPIDVETSRRDDLRRLRWELRDSLYNADRHMDEALRHSSRVEQLVGEKRELVARNEQLREHACSERRSSARRRRRDAFFDIRRHNAALTALIEPRVASLREELTRVSRRAGDEAAVKQRGYSFVLHPEDRLLGFYGEKVAVG